MNNYRWITNMLNSQRMPEQILRLFGIKRKNNRHRMMMSLLGVGLGAAAFGLARGRNNMTGQSVRNMMNSVRQSGNNVTPFNMAMEAAQELDPRRK